MRPTDLSETDCPILMKLCRIVLLVYHSKLVSEVSTRHPGWPKCLKFFFSENRSNPMKYFDSGYLGTQKLCFSKIWMKSRLRVPALNWVLKNSKNGFFSFDTYLMCSYSQIRDPPSASNALIASVFCEIDYQF